MNQQDIDKLIDTVQVFGAVNGWSMRDKLRHLTEMAWHAGCRHVEDRTPQAATEEANRRANASWALMCKMMVAAEREAMVTEAAKRGWAMKNDDPFEDAVRDIANDRARSNP